MGSLRPLPPSLELLARQTVALVQQLAHLHSPQATSAGERPQGPASLRATAAATANTQSAGMHGAGTGDAGAEGGRAKCAGAADRGNCKVMDQLGPSGMEGNARLQGLGEPGFKGMGHRTRDLGKVEAAAADGQVASRGQSLHWRSAEGWGAEEAAGAGAQGQDVRPCQGLGSSPPDAADAQGTGDLQGHWQADIEGTPGAARGAEAQHTRVGASSGSGRRHGRAPCPRARARRGSSGSSSNPTGTPGRTFEPDAALVNYYYEGGCAISWTCALVGLPSTGAVGQRVYGTCTHTIRTHNTHAHTHTVHTRTHNTHVHAHTHMRTHMHARMNAHAHTHAHTHTAWLLGQGCPHGLWPGLHSRKC